MRFGGSLTKWHSWRLPGDSTFYSNYRGEGQVKLKLNPNPNSIHVHGLHRFLRLVTRGLDNFGDRSSAGEHLVPDVCITRAAKSPFKSPRGDAARAM